MLMKVTEGNGLETYIHEPSVKTAITMMSFFETVGLGVESLTDYEPMYAGVNIDYQENLTREIRYKKEFKKFGDKRPNLYIVK